MNTNNLSVPDDATWFVAQLKPNSLQIAARNLERQRFRTFMPQQKTHRRVRNRMVETLVPMFPGYIFLNCLADARWSAVNSTYGVSRLITGPDSRPSALPIEFIRELSRRCDGQQVIVTLDDLQVGEKVKIVTGPFTNIIGQVEKMSKSDRVSLLLELMGQAGRVEVPTKDLLRV